ncbi:hypothetical protein Efla_003555 [Eimeria flavescens]
MLLYYHFVDSKKSSGVAAVTFCCTLTFALLLALLVPIDIMLATSAGSPSTQSSKELNQPAAPSVAEAAAAAHASNVSSAFTPASAAAAAAAAAGWAALKSATLPLTSEQLQRTYFFLSVAVFFCCFVLTPSAVFYASESNRRRAQDVDAYDSPPCEVFFSALKKSCFFMVGLGVVLLLLLAMRPGMPSPTFLKPGEVATQQEQQQQQQQPAVLQYSSAAGIMAAAAAAASAAAATATAAAARAAAAARRVDSEAVQLYTAQLLGVQKTGVDSLLYLGACFLCAAQVVWTVFGAYGLVALPFKWLSKRPSTEQQQREVQQEIASLRDQQRRLQSKYTGHLSAMSPQDRAKLEMLKTQQRLCTERNYKLQEAEQGRRSAYSVLCRLMQPLRKTLALSLLLLLLLMLYPPSDLWLVCCWLLLLLFGGLWGLLEMLPRLSEARKGSSDLKQHMQSVKDGGSSPQVLLLLSALLAHHILAAGLCIFTVAPQYASFGNQTFVPENGSDPISCSLHAAAAGTTCQLTIFAAALSRVAFASPVLAAILFCSNWVFLAVAVGCLVYFFFFRWRSPTDSQRSHRDRGAAYLEDMAAVDESARLLGV